MEIRLHVVTDAFVRRMILDDLDRLLRVVDSARRDGGIQCLPLLLREVLQDIAVAPDDE